MYVYADMILLINFIMDFFIFWLVGKIVKKKAKVWRLVAGAFVSAFLYCMIIFIPNLSKFYTVTGSVIILTLGIITAFFPKSFKELFMFIVLSHVTAVAVGGVGTAIFYFTNLSPLIGNIASEGVQNFSVKILISSTAAVYIIFKIYGKFLQGHLINKQEYFPIKICMDDAYIDINALVDTGNSLQDPLTNAPVIIAEFGKIKNFLPDYMKLIFYENSENDLSHFLTRAGDDFFSKRIRMIPFESLGNENGMLIGFRPDNVEIFNKKKSIVLKDVIIAIYNKSLSKEGTYNALISPSILIDFLYN